ncbi:MAG TPA: DUF2934 domain-containing protein [Nitrospiraceae bacterium]|jgi:hypothetical protein|nr:DUF2934 domain-containing protein [Nitrospiraceae bacterium]
MKKPTKSPRASNPLSRARVKPKQQSLELTDEIRGRIALKAYELYERRGHGGREMEDWLEAEQIVMAEIRRAGS